MSEGNQVRSTVASDGQTCHPNSKSMCFCMYRMAIYIPVALVMTGLAAVAMYPDLADYGYPLIGNPSETGFRGEPPCQGESPCAAGSLHTNYPLLPVENAEISIFSETGSGCCPTSRQFPLSRSAIMIEQSGDLTKPHPQDEAPDDANSALTENESVNRAN